MRFTRGFRRGGAVTLLALLGASRALATVIDFESVATGCDYDFTTQGFTFQNALNAPNLCVQNAVTRELVETQGGSYQDQSIQMFTAPYGTPFSLNSFAMNEYPLQGLNTVNVTGYKSGGGIVNWSAGLDGLAGKQTVYLPGTFTNLVQVQFVGANRNLYYLDDITVNEQFTPITGVPVPAALPLALSGFTVLLGLRRSRRVPPG